MPELKFKLITLNCINNVLASFQLFKFLVEFWGIVVYSECQLLGQLVRGIWLKNDLSVGYLYISKIVSFQNCQKIVFFFFVVVVVFKTNFSSSSDYKLVFLGGSVVKNPPSTARDVALIPGSGRSPGEGNGYPLLFSCLENPVMDRGAWQATVHGVVEESVLVERLDNNKSVKC